MSPRLEDGPTEIHPLFTTTWRGTGPADIRFTGVSLGGQNHYSYLGTNPTTLLSRCPSRLIPPVRLPGMAIVLRRKYRVTSKVRCLMMLFYTAYRKASAQFAV